MGVSVYECKFLVHSGRAHQPIEAGGPVRIGKCPLFAVFGVVFGTPPDVESGDKHTG